MAWSAPPTYFSGELWTASLANSIGANEVSIRRYQNSTECIQDSQLGIGTVLGSIGSTHYNLLTTTPDEAYRMILLGVFSASNLTGGVATVAVTAFDQLGAAVPQASESVQLSGLAVKFSVGGGNAYAAGTQQGYEWQAQTDAGTVDLTWSTFVWFNPNV